MNRLTLLVKPVAGCVNSCIAAISLRAETVAYGIGDNPHGMLRPAQEEVSSTQRIV